MGRTRRLLSRTWRLRSWQDSHARRKPRFLRYRRPPCMSLELRPEVAEAKSLASTRATLIPRSAASRKMDAPVMPPPMMRRSSVPPEILRNSPGRDQPVESAVVDQHPIHLGLVVVGFVAHVPA